MDFDDVEGKGVVEYEEETKIPLEPVAYKSTLT